MLSILFQPHDPVLRSHVYTGFRLGVVHHFLSILDSSLSGELSQVMHTSFSSFPQWMQGCVAMVPEPKHMSFSFSLDTYKRKMLNFDSNFNLTHHCKLSDTHRDLICELIKHLYSRCCSINWKLERQRTSLGDIHCPKVVYFVSVSGSRHFPFWAEISLSSFLRFQQGPPDVFVDNSSSGGQRGQRKVTLNSTAGSRVYITCEWISHDRDNMF